MTTFGPRLEVLPAAQRQLWNEFAGSLPMSLVLYGGTALALQTGGRQSEDFDFFSNEPVDAHRLVETLPFLAGAELIQSAPATATFLVDRSGPVQVSFFGNLTLGRVGDVSVSSDTRIQVASLLDLAAQKVRVVQVRAEKKDYLDLMQLLTHGVTLARALGAAQALYPDFAAMVSLKALSYFGDGDLPELPDDVKQHLARAARAIRTVDAVPVLSQRLDGR